MFARVTKSQSHQYRETWKNVPNKIIDLHICNHLHHWDTLNNFCFHVYAQKSMFIVENINAFFYITPSTDIRVHRAGSQLKMSERQTKAGNQEIFQNFHTLIHSLLTCWTTYHVYAQKSLSHTLSLSILWLLSKLWISHTLSLSILNNFYFHMYAKKSRFIAENCNS